jgi:hypothetical protein
VGEKAHEHFNPGKVANGAPIIETCDDLLRRRHGDRVDQVLEKEGLRVVRRKGSQRANLKKPEKV